MKYETITSNMKPRQTILFGGIQTIMHETKNNKLYVTTDIKYDYDITWNI